MTLLNSALFQDKFQAGVKSKLNFNSKLNMKILNISEVQSSGKKHSHISKDLAIPFYASLLPFQREQFIQKQQTTKELSRNEAATWDAPFASFTITICISL